MLKTITKIGNSQGVMLDAAMMELAHLRVGDAVNVEVHEGGTLTITPVRRSPSREEVSTTITRTMKDYARTMRRLA